MTIMPYINRSAASPYHPDDLFAGSAGGAFYDISDHASLFQDEAGTIPVTGAGQPVGRVSDLSGNGCHATQTASAARPIYQVDSSGHAYLMFDGMDDFLTVPSAVGNALGGTGDFSIVTAIVDPGMTIQAGVPLVDIAYEPSPAWNRSRIWLSIYQNTRRGELGFYDPESVFLNATADNNSLLIHTPMVLGGIRGSGRLALRTNRIEATEADTGINAGTAAQRVTIGVSASNTSDIKATLNVYGLLIINRELRGNDLRKLEMFMGSRMGIAL